MSMLRRRSDHDSYRRHRRQTALQIILPVVLAATLVLAASALISTGAGRGTVDSARLAAASVILLAVPALLAGMLVFAVLTGVVLAVTRLLRVLPPYTGRAQSAFYRVEDAVGRVTDLAVRPVMAVEGLLASAYALLGMRRGRAASAGPRRRAQGRDRYVR